MSIIVNFKKSINRLMLGISIVMKKILMGSVCTATLMGSLTCVSFAEDVVELDAIIIGIEESDAQALLGNEKITEEDLENRSPETMKDVFAGESSVTTSGGASIAQKVFVNGIEESLLSVTIDGSRQNKSAFHHTGNVLIDPELLKRVDISEGIAPADAGPGALAGLIAYETKDVRDLLDEGDDFGGILSAATGTNGTDARTSLTLFGQMEEGLEWLFSSTYHTGQNYKDGSGIVMDGTEPEITDYIAKVAYEAEAGDRFEFSASRTEDTGTRAAQAGPGGILFARPDFASVVGRTSTDFQGLSRRESASFTYTDEQPEGYWDPTIQLSYNSQEIDVSGARGVNESYSGVAKNKWSFDDGNLTAGFDFLHEKAEGESFGAGAGSGREILTNLGLFGQMRRDVNEVVSVSYGGRLDTQRFEGADGNVFSASGLSANGAIDIKLNDYITFTGGGATSWGGYELGEAALINFFTPWDYTGFSASRSKTARAGLRFEKGGFAISGAYFYTGIDDINAVLPTNGARGATSDLVSQGFDGSLSYDSGRGFVSANYTYANVKLNGDQIGSTDYYYGRPVGHIVGLEAAYDMNDEIRVGGNAQIAFENNEGATTLPGYEVFNAFATYTPEQNQNLQLRFDILNIFDETYQLRTSDGIDSSNVVALNEPGRTFQIKMRVKF